MRRLVLGAVLAYLAYGAVMTALHPRLIYPFAGEPFARAGYAQVLADGPEGPVSLQVRQGAPDAPVVLFFMGNAGALAYHTPLLAEDEAAGFTVIAVEYPGGGGLAGTPSETGMKADALAAFDHAAGLGRPVIVHGYSLGTGLALHVAARREAAAVILDAPYSRLCEIMTARSWLPACLMPFVQKWPNIRDAAEVTEPVLIRHGTGDRLVRFAQGEKLAPAFPGAVTFVPIIGAGHGDMQTRPEYGAALRSFLGPLGLLADDG